ncbi:MAG: hypothetical protein KDD66_09620 [Bdellovibrionales bacterium]|nr:hypothetical protein [Bdellovibrionales bacterium]
MIIRKSNLLAGLLFAYLFVGTIAYGGEGGELLAEQKHHSGQQSLELNQGKKWKADVHTMKSAEKMKKAADNFAKANGDLKLSDYHAQAGRQKEILDQLIQGCTMSGPAHDQLHVWIVELLPNLKKLESAKNIEAAKESFHHLNSSIHEFGRYFH